MLKRCTIAALGLALAVPALAQGHVTVAPTEAEADSYVALDIDVPHGCEDAATTEIRVQIPETVPSATPGVHPGWSLATKEGPKQEVELHGESVTRGVSEVIWKAEDEPLPAHFLDRFIISVKLPDAPGETIYFPVVQKCEQGETAWIQVPAEGEGSEELDEPAPAVTLTAAEGESQDIAADDSEDGNGLAIAGLVAGALGLIAGGTALARTRD